MKIIKNEYYVFVLIFCSTFIVLPFTLMYLDSNNMNWGLIFGFLNIFMSFSGFIIIRFFSDKK